MNIFRNFMLYVGIAGMILFALFNHLFRDNDFLMIAIPIALAIFIMVGVWMYANNARNKNKVD